MAGEGIEAPMMGIHHHRLITTLGWGDGGWSLRMQPANAGPHRPRADEYQGGYGTRERELVPSLHCRM